MPRPPAPISLSAKQRQTLQTKEASFAAQGRRRWADRCRAILLRDQGYGIDEFTNSSNPNAADTDGDRILDGDEGIGNLTQIEGADPSIVGEPSLSVTFVYATDPVIGLLSIPTRIDLIATVHVADNAAVQSVTIEVVGQGERTARLDSTDGLRTATASATFGFEWFSSFVDGYDVAVVVADVNGNGITADSHVDGLAEGIVEALVAAVTSVLESVQKLAAT